MANHFQQDPSLENPFAEAKEQEFVVPGQINYKPGLYEEALKAGQALIDRPKTSAGVVSIASLIPSPVSYSSSSRIS